MGAAPSPESPSFALYSLFQKCGKEKVPLGAGSSPPWDCSLYSQDVWALRKNFPDSNQNQHPCCCWLLDLEPHGTPVVLFTLDSPSEIWRQRLGTPSPLPNTGQPLFPPSDRHSVTQTPSPFNFPERFSERGSDWAHPSR